MMKPTAADDTPMWSHSFVTVGITCRARLHVKGLPRTARPRLAWPPAVGRPGTLTQPPARAGGGGRASYSCIPQ